MLSCGLFESPEVCSRFCGLLVKDPPIPIPMQNWSKEFFSTDGIKPGSKIVLSRSKIIFNFLLKTFFFESERFFKTFDENAIAVNFCRIRKSALFASIGKSSNTEGEYLFSACAKYFTNTQWGSIELRSDRC